MRRQPEWEFGDGYGEHVAGFAVRASRNHMVVIEAGIVRGFLRAPFTHESC